MVQERNFATSLTYYLSHIRKFNSYYERKIYESCCVKFYSFRRFTNVVFSSSRTLTSSQMMCNLNYFDLPNKQVGDIRPFITGCMFVLSCYIIKFNNLVVPPEGSDRIIFHSDLILFTATRTAGKY